MRAIRTYYIGASNVKGSRIKAVDDCERHRSGHSVTLSYDDDKSSDENHRMVANALKKKMNWHGRMVMGSLKDGCVFVFLD
jgi:hypothetical protein